MKQIIHRLLALLLAFCLAWSLQAAAFAADFFPITDIQTRDSLIVIPVDVTDGDTISLMPVSWWVGDRVATLVITDTGGTGATLTCLAPNEYRLQASAPGTVTLKASVADGTALGVAFEKLFTVEIGPGLTLTKNFGKIGRFSGFRSGNVVTAHNAWGTVNFESSDPSIVTVERSIADLNSGFVKVVTKKAGSAEIIVTTTAGQRASIPMQVKSTWYEWIVSGVLLLAALIIGGLNPPPPVVLQPSPFG